MSKMLERAKSFWGWFIKKSPAFIVLTSLTVVSVFGLGVGGTLAATGVIPNPFTSSTVESLEGTSGDLNANDEDVVDNNEEEGFPGWDSYFNYGDNQYITKNGDWLPGSSWSPLGTSEYFSYRWTSTHFHVRYVGQCPNEEVWVVGSAPNFGYLSDVVYRPESPENGIYGLSQYEFLGVAKHSNSQPNCKTSNGLFVGSMKCYNFNEVWVWIRTTGSMPDLGLLKIPIPEEVIKVDCPPGSENNDPTRFTAGWDLTNYPQAVVTPPTRTSPPIVVPGQYAPPTSPTTEPSPTSEPSQTPTAETSPSPTTETSPTPNSP